MKGDKYDQLSVAVITAGANFVGGARVVEERPEGDKDLKYVTLEVSTYEDIKKLEIILGRLGIVDNEHNPDRVSGKVGSKEPIEAALVCVRAFRSSKTHSYRAVLEDTSIA